MSVARAYAKALHDAALDAKISSQDLVSLERDMEQFANLLESSREVHVALAGPATSSKDKQAIVSEIAKRTGASRLLTSFLLLLARKQRMGLLPEVREAFAAVRLESEGAVLGRLVSAEPLESTEVETLSKAFEQKLGKRVAFRTATDPALLAGVKATVNGVTYDGTLKAQLQRLRDRLVYDASSAH